MGTGAVQDASGVMAPQITDGEFEPVGDVEVTHRFVEAARSTYHLVTAGDPGARPVVLLHGFRHLHSENNRGSPDDCLHRV